MNFQQQAEAFMSELTSRKDDPVRPNTLHVYRSILDARILPAIGGVEMADVNNATAKLLVGRLTEARLSPATITLAVSLMKKIVKSAWDERGNRLYPVEWNPEFIKAPRIDQDAQKTPITASQTLTEAISRTKGEVQAVVALLGGTALRIGEALALKVGPDNGVDSYWDPQAGTLTIRSTMVHGHIQPNPKTRAGKRVVDLDPSLNSFLIGMFPNVEGRLFKIGERTLRRRIEKLGIHGFHSMRRFRITHLQGISTPPMLIKFWAGHAAKDTTEGYTKMGAQIEERKSWSEKAGLGFQL